MSWRNRHCRGETVMLCLILKPLIFSIRPKYLKIQPSTHAGYVFIAHVALNSAQSRRDRNIDERSSLSVCVSLQISSYDTIFHSTVDLKTNTSAAAAPVITAIDLCLERWKKYTLREQSVDVR